MLLSTIYCPFFFFCVCGGGVISTKFVLLRSEPSLAIPIEFYIIKSLHFS